MVIHCSILAWRIPRTEEPGRLQSMASQRVEHERLTLNTFSSWNPAVTQSSINCISLCHLFANKGPYSQHYGFPSSHVRMWELDQKEGWGPKNWCFWTVVLEKTLESSLDCKEIQTVHPKGDQSGIFIGRTNVEAETPILWPPDWRADSLEKNPDAGKDWRQKEKGTAEDEMVGWHHRLNRHEFGQTPGDGEVHGSQTCCSPWGRKELDMTEQLNWTEILAIFQEQQWSFSYFLYTSIRISHRNNHCLQILTEHLPKLFYSAIKSTSEILKCSNCVFSYQEAKIGNSTTKGELFLPHHYLPHLLEFQGHQNF